MLKAEYVTEILRQIEKDSDNNIQNLKLVVSKVKTLDNKVDYACLYCNGANNMIYHKIVDDSLANINNSDILEAKSNPLNDFEIINL